VERVQAEAPRHGAPAPQPAPWKGTASAAADLPELAVLPTLGDSDTHYIGDAGLVLLATYSQRLFGMLDLLDGKTLRDAQAAARAVRCLAWLAHGHDQASEPECVLPKLLCGMPLDAPLVGEGALDAATRRLLDDLIGAVIGHWSALGKTSPEGLRQTFLLREGRLTRESNDSGHHWRLAVKPGPFDMLLDRLPWSFSTIKLPWMQEVMYVDWR
ncbi:contractile injection system tape measure protein, partial [Cupriavidus campinensis]